MSKPQWDLVIYGPIFFIWLCFELTPIFWSGCPWTTLSGGVWFAIKDWPPLAYAIAVAGVALIGHFDLHWSVHWLIAITLLTAATATAHVVTR